MAKKSKLKSEDPSHQDEQVIDCKVVVLVDVIILIQNAAQVFGGIMQK